MLFIRGISKVLLVIVIATLLVSCPSFHKASYQGLGAMAVAYDVGMNSAVDLHARGFISEEGKTAIIKHAASYANAHNAAVQAFQDYINAPEEDKADAKGQAIVAMQAALGFYAELLGIFTNYGVYGEPVEPWF